MHRFVLLKKLVFTKLCDLIAVRSTTFIGDVMLVIEGLLSVMEERLEEGDVIQMGCLGNFRMVAGSKGTENEKDFKVFLFNKGSYRLLTGHHAQQDPQE